MSSSDTNKEFFGTYWWNENMVAYLSLSAGSRWFAYLLDEILHEIPPAAVTRVADVGCGVGMKTAQLARYFPNAAVTGYDFSEPGIAAATKHFGSVPNLEFLAQDVTKVSHDTEFDLVTAFDVLEHIDDWQALADSLLEVNRRYVIISVPVGRMRPYEVHIGHFRNFEHGEIEEFMRRRGYRTVKTFYAGFPFYSPILRDLTNRFFRAYSKTPHSDMGFLARRGHDVWYFLFRYCSSNSHGDNFIGLFERTT